MIRPLVVSAVTTAFHDDGAIDMASTRRVFEHVLAAGVDAIFVNGTTAEFAALTAGERHDLLAAAVDVAGADRVIAHVGAASPYGAARLAEDACGLGIAALSVLTPFYMPSSLDGVRSQLGAVRDVAPDASTYLYLFPDRTGVAIAAADTAVLIEEFDLAGAKVSIPGTEYVAQLVRELAGGRTILSGNDGLMREIVHVGGAGVVSGVSSSVPAPFVALADAIGRGDVAEEERIARRVNEIVPVLGPSIAGLKVSQLRQGLIESAFCRMAIDPIGAEEDERIADVLRRSPSGDAFRVA